MRPLLANPSRLVMWKGITTMRQSGLFWATLVSAVCCLMGGELAAQRPAPSAPARMGVSENNLRVRNAGQTAAQPTSRDGMQPQQPVSEMSSIAVIGAVKTPMVFETTERAIPLQTLIQRAGGETADSIGTVRIMQHAKTRYMTDLKSHLDLALTDGQVVFVLPRGGRPAQVVDPRKAPPDRFVLISGLAPGPLLFNIGNQSRTFADLLQLLGQSPELVDRQQVLASLPHGQSMQLNSLLVHNTVIDFDPQAVNIDGVREAVDRGFRYETPVKFDSTATAPAKEAVPANAAPMAPVPAQPAPTKSVPIQAAPAAPLPMTLPQAMPARTIPPATTDTNSDLKKSGIERAGSSIQFEEPLPFPKPAPFEMDATGPAPHIKSDGRPPLMLPRTWQNPEDAGTEPAVEDPVRVIERTSADLDAPSRHIVTVSAEVEDQNASQPRSTPTADPQPIETATRATKTSMFGGSLSWPILLSTIGVAVASVVVTRLLSRKGIITGGLDTHSASTDSTTPGSAATREPALEDEQRFLQRLILNKFPLVEEEATLPPVDRLHGMAIGGRRLVIHDAHEGVAGPHFQVREAGDTREIELRLRRLLRPDRSGTKQTAVVVKTAEVVGTRASRVSPLEKALRTVAPKNVASKNVGRGDAQ